jgi:hypothetical protein
MLACNPLQVHVAAHVAVHVSDILNRDRPRIKPLVAAPATPGPQQCDTDDVVFQTSPARTAWTVTMTDRAQQFVLLPWKPDKKNT